MNTLRNFDIEVKTELPCFEYFAEKHGEGGYYPQGYNPVISRD